MISWTDYCYAVSLVFATGLVAELVIQRAFDRVYKRRDEQDALAVERIETALRKSDEAYAAMKPPMPSGTFKAPWYTEPPTREN